MSIEQIMKNHTDSNLNPYDPEDEVYREQAARHSVMSLEELQNWNLRRTNHLRGSEHLAKSDILWEMPLEGEELDEDEATKNT
eukprot:UN30079